jgi:hypothetical protein
VPAIRTKCTVQRALKFQNHSKFTLLSLNVCRTISIMLVKKDVESGEYRDAVVALDTYSKEKKLPKVGHVHVCITCKSCSKNIFDHMKTPCLDGLCCFGRVA